jgi:RNA recognition motif-containing protein
VKSHIAKDKETGKPRGFAFVEMSSDDETAKAIEGLDGHTINGRSIVVKEAEDRGNSRPQARSFDSNRPRRDDRPQRAERTYTPPVKEDSPFMNEREDTSTSEPVKKTKRGKGGKKKVSGPDNSSESRENKMSAYKKSGKKNNFHLDEDDDWELELLKSKKRGWTDEEEEF